MINSENDSSILDKQEDSHEKRLELHRAKTARRKVKSLKGTFLVYIVKQGEDIIYIGSGAHGREQHCLSGCSHVYGLNERHFSNVKMDVLIVKRFSDKTESLEYEKQMICIHRPLLNIKGNPAVKTDCNSMIRKYWEEYFCTLDQGKHRRYGLLLDQMLDYYGAKALTSGGVSLDGYDGRNKVPRCIFSLVKSVKRPIPKEKYKEMYELTGIASGKISITTKPPAHLFEKESKETND